MAETEQQSENRGRSDGLVRKMVKSAATPIVASVATAASAYLTRKAAELAREKLLPKIREKGGGRAAAKETLENVAGKVTGPAEQTLSALAEKVRGGDDEGQSREEARRGREQRRNERRRDLKQSGSS
jgi:CO/xanthine dehydrogenase Mo-binding subunit